MMEKTIHVLCLVGLVPGNPSLDGNTRIPERVAGTCCTTSLVLRRRRAPFFGEDLLERQSHDVRVKHR
jgi:hypothetical protein